MKIFNLIVSHKFMYFTIIYIFSIISILQIKYHYLRKNIFDISLKKDFIIKNSNVENDILNKYFNEDKNVYLCSQLSNCRFKPFPDVFIYAFKDIVNKNNIKLKDGDKLFIVEDSKAGCEAGKSFKQEYGNIIDIKIIGYTASMRFKEYKTEYTKKLINAGADIIAKTSEEIFKIIVD